jgi:hypothetical protein
MLEYLDTNQSIGKNEKHLRLTGPNRELLLQVSASVSEGVAAPHPH